jgi:hypothetical protein
MRASTRLLVNLFAVPLPAGSSRLTSLARSVFLPRIAAAPTHQPQPLLLPLQSLDSIQFHLGNQK